MVSKRNIIFTFGVLAEGGVNKYEVQYNISLLKTVVFRVLRRSKDKHTES